MMQFATLLRMFQVYQVLHCKEILLLFISDLQVDSTIVLCFYLVRMELSCVYEKLSVHFFLSKLSNI